MFKSLNKDRVIYRVSDLETARRWYCMILGREPTFEAEFGVVFPVGNSELVLYPDAAKRSRSSDGVVAYWGVDDVDAAYKLLVESGAASRTATSTVPGTRRASVVDPFGNVIGIVAAPEIEKGSVR